MAQRTASKKQNKKKKGGTEVFAILSLTGVLEEVFVGEKYAFATIKVPQATDNDYYDKYKVAFPLDYDFPEDGEEIDVNCSVSTFFDKKKKCMKYSFNAII